MVNPGEGEGEAGGLAPAEGGHARQRPGRGRGARPCCAPMLYSTFAL